MTRRLAILSLVLFAIGGVAFAAPSLVVDLKRDSEGHVVLDAQGRLQWIVGINVDGSLFAGEPGSESGSVRVDAGFALGERFPQPPSNQLLVQASTVNTLAYDQAVLGYSVFGDETSPGVLEYYGVHIGTNPNSVFVSLAGGNFTENGFVELMTFTSRPINANQAAEQFLTWGGAYGADGQLIDAVPDNTQLGTHGLLSQSAAGSSPTLVGIAGSASFRPTLGDSDLRDGVDLDDFNVVLDNFGTGTTWAQGNFDGNNSTGLTDFGQILDNFGRPSAEVIFTYPSAGSMASSTLVVPEPSTLGSLSLAALLAFGWRRMRHA